MSPFDPLSTLPIVRIVRDEHGERVVIAYIRCPGCRAGVAPGDVVTGFAHCVACGGRVDLSTTWAQA